MKMKRSETLKEGGGERGEKTAAPRPVIGRVSSRLLLCIYDAIWSSFV